MLKALSLGVIALAAVSLGCNKPEETQQPGGQQPAGQQAAANNGAPAQGGAQAQPGPPQEPVRNADGIVPGSVDDPRYHGPEVAKGRGDPNGVVILWPRVIPSNIAEQNVAMAASLQQHMKDIVARALPGRPVEVRPKPERVCPQGGCAGPSINVLFSRQSNACVAVAIVSGPGESMQKMVPWGGQIVFKGGDTAPFRQPPENQITIKDYVPCDSLMGELTKQDPNVEAALRAAAAQAR